MNFVELCRLHEQRGNDRQAIADALRMTVDEIDLWQGQAVELARDLDPDTGGHENISG